MALSAEIIARIQRGAEESEEWFRANLRTLNGLEDVEQRDYALRVLRGWSKETQALVPESGWNRYPYGSQSEPYDWEADR